MRQILFRGYNRKNNKWLYGYYLVNRGLHFICPEGVQNPLASWEDFVVEEESVGQWTGLTDADGKEIYEGDIFQVKAYEPKFEVYFEDGVFEYRKIGSPGKSLPLRRIHFDSYVLGNVHDNPELLEDKE